MTIIKRNEEGYMEVRLTGDRVLNHRNTCEIINLTGE
jgi:hypothetical protein